MKFTEASIAGFSAPPGKASAVTFDSQVTGLGLKATAKGTKIFIFQFWSGARVHRMTLGKYGDLTLTEARRIAATMRVQVASGANPAEDRKQRIASEKKRAEKNSLTLEALILQWEALALRDRSSSYSHEATRALRRTFAAHLQKPAEELSSRDIQVILDQIAVSHPTTSRRVRAYARAMYSWAVKRNLVSANPCASVVVEGREVARDRVLTDAELGAVWRAAGKLSVTAGAFVRLSILTLQRRNEVSGMLWSEIAADLSTWTVPAERAKNRRAHLVHLPAPARKILENLPREGGTDLVFAVPKRAGVKDRVPISGFSDLTARLHEAIREEREGAPRVRRKKGDGGYKRGKRDADWTHHDYRRTGVTILARLNFPQEVCDKLLNHVGGKISGVAAVYQRYEFMPARQQALKAWAAYILAVASGKEPPLECYYTPDVAKTSKRKRKASDLAET